MAIRGMFSARSLFFWLAATGILMTSIDGTIVAVAIPALKVSLDTSLNWVGWTLTSFQLIQLIVMPLAGKLSDGFGRKRVFVMSVSLFTVGSLLCGLAPNIGLLIVFRVIQAIGAGGVMPSAVGIVSDQFKERRNQAIGLFSSVFPIGGILGPNIGGWILENWTWREIFFVNLPIGIIILIGTQLILHEPARRIRAPRIDFGGLGLFVGGVISFMYAMTWVGTEAGAWKTLPFWMLVATGIVLLVLFVRQERRVDEPLLDVELVARWPFLPTNIYNFFFGAAVWGSAAFIPYYAVVRYGMAPSLSGAVLTSRSVGSIIMATVFSLFLIRLGYRIPMIAGMLFISLSLILISFGWGTMSLGPLELDGFWVLFALVGLAGIGTGMSSPAANNASMDLAPNKAAAITGLRGMFRGMGAVMGVSSIVLVLSFFDDQAAGIQVLYVAIAIMFMATIPLVMMIPDSARERRLKKNVKAETGAAQEPIVALQEQIVIPDADLENGSPGPQRGEPGG